MLGRNNNPFLFSANLSRSVQASGVGEAAFGVGGRGRSGAASFGRLPDSWEALVAGGDVLTTAAEVVLGRRDLLDLTTSGMPRVFFDEVGVGSLSVPLHIPCTGQIILSLASL